MVREVKFGRRNRVSGLVSLNDFGPCTCDATRNVLPIFTRTKCPVFSFKKVFCISRFYGTIWCLSSWVFSRVVPQKLISTNVLSRLQFLSIRPQETIAAISVLLPFLFSLSPRFISSGRERRSGNKFETFYFPSAHSILTKKTFGVRQSNLCSGLQRIFYFFPLFPVIFP